MAGISNAFCTSAKVEFFTAGHCFNQTVTPTATMASGSTSVTTVSSMSGVAVGMGVTGTSVGAGSVVATITGPAAMSLSVASTAAITGGTLTVAGDIFKIALFKAGVAGTFGATTVNYTDMGADETSGAGYSATGVALTNVSATSSSGTAFINFSPNPSWTSATFSTDGALIYNTSVRVGGTSGTNTTGGGRAIGTFSFGGTQTVSAGTLTVLFPSATNTTAIFRLS